MSRARSVQDFVRQKKLALVGASRSGQKFGNTILNELKGKGYTVYPIHPDAVSISGEPCYSSFAALPEAVDGAVVSVKPERTSDVVRDAHAAGITRVWIQQGAESNDAIAYCEEHGVDVVTGECLLMFVEPVESIHRLHRFFKRILGRMPA
ncbi:MAG TPA: CoA-binding protein [Spirochaetia bacterium]|nr:CoA-binding protein [Spirochaetia bacterium]